MAKTSGKNSAKFGDMRVKSDDQLSGDLGDLKREAFNLRFQAATNQLERPARIKEVRRDIARIKTLHREKELVKLGGLGTEQLGTRIAALAAKEAASAPGKRTAHRQGARLTRFYVAKGGTLPVAPVVVAAPPAAPVPAPAAPVPAAKTEAKTDAKKPDPKKADAKKTGSVKGSGK